MGCYDQHKHEKYQRPEWLPGKLYTTLLTQENLTLFSECLQRTGLDTILNTSGAWTVFAPTDEAMEEFLRKNQYADISDISLDELEKIARFHIVQNPWSLDQLQSLGAYGWRKENDKNWNSFAYKRQTILKKPVEKYWVKGSKDKEGIVIDSLQADRYKRVFVESRKYVPIFYDEYLEMNNLSSEDYSFYFDRVYEHGNIYYAGA
ncbi:MAG: fasciclin domain-containing protein, partial [bacterium]